MTAAARPTPRAASPIALERRYGARNYDPLPVVLVARRRRLAVGHRRPALPRHDVGLLGGELRPRPPGAGRARSPSRRRRLAVTSRAFHSDRLGALPRAPLRAHRHGPRAADEHRRRGGRDGDQGARKWAYKVKGVPAGQAEIIVCAGNFAGRTTTIVGFSTEPQYRDGFGPFAPGFRQRAVRRRRGARGGDHARTPPPSWSSRCRARPASSCRPTATSPQCARSARGTTCC